MSTAALIPETKRKSTDAPRELSTAELVALFGKLPETTSAAEKEAIQIQILEGWYGRRFSRLEFEQIQKEEREMFPQYTHA